MTKLQTRFGPEQTALVGRSLKRRWHRQGLTLLAALGTLVLASVTPALAATQQLVQISSDPYTNSTSNHKTEVEPDTFAFGNTIVSAFQVGRFFDGGASNIGWATSTNGGATWTSGFLPRTTTLAHGRYARVSDPSVAFDAEHNVWLISYLGLVSTSAADVVVSRSTTGGLTWGNPVAVDARGTTAGQLLDKNWTVCDDTASSPFYGHCYTEFDNNSKLNLVQMTTSQNGGLTWDPAKTTPDQACVIGGQPVVQPNGTVIVPIDSCFETEILSFRSTDGGKTWSRVSLAAQIINNGNPGAIRSPDLPSAEIDKSGRVYVVWSDCRFEAFCSAPTGTNDLLLITSDDGVHWTVPKRIPIDPIGNGADRFIPGLAVDKSTAGNSAHLGLAYYNYPDSSCTTTCQLRVGFISSTNGGASWSAPEQLAGPMTLTWLPLTTQGFMVGDYISTSIVSADNHATSVFAVATAPTPPPNCSNLTTGAAGLGCHEAMFTTPEDVVKTIGGTNVSNDGAPVAMPAARSRTSGRATAF
jgi:hypothetical protein